MPFLQQVLKGEVFDNFDRANGTLGTDWTTENVAGGNAAYIPQVISNSIRMPTATANNTNFQGIAIHLTSLNSDNMRVEAPCGNANTGLLGGAIVRSTADRQNFIVAHSTTSSVRIQYRNAGTFSAIQSTINGNFFTTGDTFVLEAEETQYRVKRIRSGTETLIGGWNDTGGLFTRSSDRNRMGYVGQCDRNAFGTTNVGLWFTQMFARDL